MIVLGCVLWLCSEFQAGLSWYAGSPGRNLDCSCQRTCCSSAFISTGLLRTCRSSRLRQIVFQSLSVIRLPGVLAVIIVKLPLFLSATLPLPSSSDTSVNLVTLTPALHSAFPHPTCLLVLPARPAAIPDKPHHSQCHHYPP